MTHNKKSILFFFLIIFLSLIFSRILGILFINIIGHPLSQSFFSTGCPECFVGFSMLFSFLSGLLFFGFLDKSRIKIALIFVFLSPLIDLLSGDGEALLVDLAFGLLGLGLGEIVYLIRKKKIKK
jgi:hypothetical protein